MDDTADLRRCAFEAGYRMLGSATEADDIAQETILRVSEPIEQGRVDNPEAFTTTVATRLSIDHLRSARVRREEYRGPWLPEPIVQRSEDPAEVADSVSYALLVVLESLSPLERAAFLLREVFAYEYGEVAEALGRTESACRQLVVRARRHVDDRRPRLPVDPDEHRVLVERFLDAAGGGDLPGLVDVLAEDVRLWSDGGPHRQAARHPIAGRDRVSRFVANVLGRLLDACAVELVTINGEPGFLLEHGGGVHLVGTVEAVDGRITAVRWVLNPEKLGSVT
ncbi:MAG: RNA polymerase sigma factor SigJ [Actinomycetota bacterium]